MKMLKKSLCVFLSILMLFSALSISLVAYAADISYRALAYYFFDYSVESSGFTSNYVVKTDENGYPAKSIVGVMDQYEVSNTSDDYVYADEKENPIRSISYVHTVTAKDNSTNRIRSAALEYLAIADQLMSYEYGTGLYTIPMVADEVIESLKFTKGDDGEYLFLDGYTYLENAVGELIGRSPVPTYEVVDGEIKELDVDESWVEDIEGGAEADQVTLFGYCNVETVIGYFSGYCTSVNSGNWYHTYQFHCYTDMDTVLRTETLVNQNLTVRYLTIDWKMERQYDDSGTVAQYYNGGYTVDKNTTAVDTTRVTLSALKGNLDMYFSEYYADGVLGGKTNANLLATDYAKITQYHDTFSKLSNDAKIAVFGQAAFSYINLVTQLTPIVNTASPYDATYWPKHTYTKYQDDSGNDVVYQVDAQKVTSIVSTIDDLLKSDRVGTVLKQFFDYSGPEYADKAYYYDAQTASTPQDLLKILIADMLYSDEMVNMVLTMIYPMVCNLLDENLTDELINGTLNDLFSGLDSIVEWIVENDEGWLGLIYGVLTSIGVGLTPAGVAYVWNTYGYNNNNYFPNMTKNHDHLQDAEGGTKSKSGNGWYETPGYMSIGVEGDKYHLDRWRYVDSDYIVWGVNGDRTRFQNALCAVLAPLAPLLGVLLGNQKSELKVGQLAFDIILVLEDFTIYNDVLLPLLETLGIPGLASGEKFESLAASINSDDDRNKTTIENFLNQGLLDPLLNWVEDVVLADPITVVLNLLPNLSYYLTSGALLASLDTIKIPIGLKFGIDYGAVYTLTLADLGIDDETLGFLDSLQGIIDLIGFGVDTGIPIIGYYAEGDTMVYRPGDAGYNEDVTNIPTTEAYMSESGSMSIYQDDEYNTLVTGTNADGSYNAYAIRNDIAWANAAGVVVTQRNNESATAEEYYIPVNQYYEYTVIVDETTGDSLTYKVRYEYMLPEDVLKNGEYSLVEEVVTEEVPVELPAIMDYKLQAVGTLSTVASGRYSDFSMTNKEGVSETWTALSRKYIDVQVGGMETEGLVLLFLFRYIFSALMYRTYDTSANGFTSEYTLLNAFGISNEQLSDELFAGLSLGDILNNVALHPDEAIAALYELFYKNEFGSIYEVVNGFVQENTVGYTYDIEYVDYHTEDIMAYAEEYNDYTYGTSVLYTEYWSKEKASYVVDNLDDIVENVLAMLKMDGVNSLGEFLEGFIGDFLYSNELLSDLASMLYGMLSSMDGIDLPGVLDAALDVDMTKKALADALYYEFGSDVAQNGSYVDEETGETVVVQSVYSKLVDDQKWVAYYENEAQKALSKQDIDLYYQHLETADKYASYDDNTFYKTGTDVETGELIVFESLDWGFYNEALLADFSQTEIFLRAASAILSPFAIIFKFLFLGEDLSVLNLINIPTYEAYYYAWIPLMETLGATDGLLDFKQYFELAFNGSSETAMNCDTVYYFVKPLFAFIESVIENPIEKVLDLIPNLLFIISIGGLNDVVNNLIHFAYVLLDILQPVFDAYPLLNSLVSNIRIGDFTINISIPLDFDFNQLVNQLLSGLLGESLAFDIENKNIVLGTEWVEKEVAYPLLDADGNEQYDEEGNLLVYTQMEMVEEEVYAVGTLNIALPYIDFSTLCAGTMEERVSVSGVKYVYLNSAGGADLITLVLRLVADTLFYKDNAINIANFLIGFCQLDDEEDNDDLLMEIFIYLNEAANEAEFPDKMLGLIYTIYTILVPIADQLGTRFKNVDFSITDLFDSIEDPDLLSERINALLNAGEGGNSTLSGFGRLIELIKQFFAKLAAFFRGLFGG